MKAARFVLTRAKRLFPALPDAESPLDRNPYITRQTVAYALSLVVSAVCYSRTDPTTKALAPKLNEKLYVEMTKLTDEEFEQILEERVIEYLSDDSGIMTPVWRRSRSPPKALLPKSPHPENLLQQLQVRKTQTGCSD